MPLPNPSFEPKTHRWRPGAGAPSREVPSQICAVLGQKKPFFAPNSLKTLAKRPNEGKRWVHFHVRLDFTVSKSLQAPFNSTICPRNGPKRRQKAPKSAQCAPTPRNHERAVSWATWLKNEFRGHLVHPRPPTFCGFQAAESPNETPRPPYQWSLGAAGGQRPAHGEGQRWVHQGPRGAKNHFFQSCSSTTWDAQTSVFRPC